MPNGDLTLFLGISLAKDGPYGPPSRLRWLRIGVVAILILLTLTSCTPRHGPTSGTKNALAASHALHIATLSCDGAEQNRATGFMISETELITVAHGLSSISELMVKTGQDIWAPAAVAHFDAERDLAVLKIKPGHMAPNSAPDAPIWASAEVGDTVWLQTPKARASQRNASSRTEAESIPTTIVRELTLIVAPVTPGSDTKVRRGGYEIELHIERGQSGSVLTNEKGEIVGMVFAASTKKPNSAWVTSANEIETMFNQYQNEPNPVTKCALPAGVSLALD